MKKYEGEKYMNHDYRAYPAEEEIIEVTCYMCQKNNALHEILEEEGIHTYLCNECYIKCLNVPLVKCYEYEMMNYYLNKMQDLALSLGTEILYFMTTEKYYEYCKFQYKIYLENMRYWLNRYYGDLNEVRNM